MKQILVTGGSGFVGTKVIKYLESFDVDITIINRRKSMNSLKLNSKIKNIIESEDIFNESIDWWEKSFENIDAVVHLAWYAKPGKYLSSLKNNHCYEGTLKMARASINTGIKRFLGIGSCFEYKFSDSPIDIDQKLSPKSSYAESKVKTYLSLKNIFEPSKIDFLWCRLFYLFGEGEAEKRLVTNLHKQLKNGEEVKLTNGNEIKDYLDVNLAGKIIANLTLSHHTGAYNVCSGKETSIKSLALSIAKEYGREDLLNFGAYKAKKTDPHYFVGKKTDAEFEEKL